MKHIILSISNLWKMLFLTVVLLPILLISSCIDEPFSSNSSKGTDVEVKVFLQVPAPALAETRSETKTDDYYDQNNVFLLIFDGNTDDSKLQQMAKTSVGGSNILYTRLKAENATQYVYVVANVQDLVQTHKSSWILGTTTLSTIKSQLKPTLPIEEDVLIGMITPQPMIGFVEVNGIGTGTEIGTSGNPIQLSRSTVKISLENKTENANIIGANLIQSPTEGYLFAMPDETLKTITKANSGDKGDINDPIAKPATPGGKSCYLYSFESPASGETDVTGVLLKVNYLGTDYYYRISLHNKTTYALLRNCNYIVTINAIKKVGYATAEEAIAGSADNLDYTINVTDASSRDIVSNGKYYLGVSNSEFYYYTDDKNGLKDMEITTVTHNAPEGLTGTCVCLDGSITITQNPFAKGTDNVQFSPLKITLANGYETGKITLTLGDLTKVITVHRKDIVDSDKFRFGGFFKDFKKKGYISGKVDSQYESWIKLTNEEDEKNQNEDNQHSSIEQVDEEIFVRVKANLGSNTSPKYRDGEISLFRKDEGGSARVVFHQKMYDIYSKIVDQAKLSPYTYVGTFHRWDETGERLIRIHADNIGGGSNEFHWKVFIVTGDFIRLSAEESNDPGINFYEPYGKGDKAQWNTTKDVEANGQLEYPKTELTVTGRISFRVGLTSRLTSASSKPRYGLIAVVANWDTDKPITRYIYVRQGEEPDYLMRKEDAMVEPAAETSPERPYAEIFSPYNLITIPKNNKTSDPDNDYTTDFVKFPSQAGYLYEAVYALKNDLGRYTYTKGRGWPADGSSNAAPSLKTYLELWEPRAFENCPIGYRHPKGHIYNDAVGLPGGVLQSPIRQSLWLYPQNGTISSGQNFIIGYLADGYYDRREMHGKNSDDDSLPKSEQDTYVEDGAARAYIGALAFNPYNSASLFLPFSGTRQSGKHSNYGRNAYFGTSNKKVEGRFWAAACGLLPDPEDPSSSTEFRADNYGLDSNNPSSVRCVKK